MEERKHILDYAAQVLVIFGFTMVCMMVNISLFGEGAQGFSKLFALGNQGMAIAVMAQFLLLSVIIVGLRYFFFTDRFLKKMSALGRTVFMVLAILAVSSGCIIAFEWFPITMWQPWIMFFLFFFVCFGCSLAVSVVKTRQEDKRLEEGLARLKEKWEDEHGR